MQLLFHFADDHCYRYKNLSEANRNRIHETSLSGPVLRDIQLPEGWYRFVGATGTKIQIHSDVVQNGQQAGWLVLILQWKMVKFARRSALVIVTAVANTMKSIK